MKGKLNLVSRLGKSSSTGNRNPGRKKGKILRYPTNLKNLHFLLNMGMHICTYLNILDSSRKSAEQKTRKTVDF